MRVLSSHASARAAPFGPAVASAWVHACMRTFWSAGAIAPAMVDAMNATRGSMVAWQRQPPLLTPRLAPVPPERGLQQRSPPNPPRVATWSACFQIALVQGTAVRGTPNARKPTLPRPSRRAASRG
eukprot:38457-Chlamydomonas_euryale.AAC.8